MAISELASLLLPRAPWNDQARGVNAWESQDMCSEVWAETRATSRVCFCSSYGRKSGRECAWKCSAIGVIRHSHVSKVFRWLSGRILLDLAFAAIGVVSAEALTFFMPLGDTGKPALKDKARPLSQVTLQTTGWFEVEEALIFAVFCFCLLDRAYKEGLQLAQVVIRGQIHGPGLAMGNRIPVTESDRISKRGLRSCAAAAAAALLLLESGQARERAGEWARSWQDGGRIEQCHESTPRTKGASMWALS